VKRLALALALALALVVLAGLGASAWWFVLRAPVAHDATSTYIAKREKFVRRVNAEGNLRAVKGTKITAPQGAGDFGPMKVAWLAPDGVFVKQGDPIAKFDPSDPEKRLRDGQSDLASANTKYASEQIKARTAVAGREADAEMAASELEQTKRFQSKDAQIFSRNQIIESEIDANLADAKQTHASQAKQIEHRRSQSSSAVIAVQRQKAQLAVDHANMELRSMELDAPYDGILVLNRNGRGQLRKVGDSLFPGQPVGEIPRLDTMEAEVYVLEVDGSGLVENQAAEVIVEARPEQVWQGKVRIVDKLAQPRDPNSPVNYFGVTIALATTDKSIMKPGQRVRATLVLDQEDAIVVPRQAVFEKDNKPVVYKRTATGFTTQAVELGVSSAGRVVIKTGLARGDEIALRDPTRTLDALGSGADSPSKATKEAK
jgi:HlyD family secretion protein